MAKFLKAAVRIAATFTLLPEVAVSLLEAYASIYMQEGLLVTFGHLGDVTQAVVLFLLSWGVLHLYWKNEHIV